MLPVKKAFNGQLWVKGDVELRDGALLTGVDLSDLFERLDSVKSFNTELKEEELEIGGYLQTKSFNEFGSEFVQQILTTRLRKSIPQMITLPVSYNHGRLNASELYFNYTASGGKFPTDYIHRNESDPNLVIFGSKYFTAPVAMNELDVGPPAGLVNGHSISQLYGSMVKNDTRTGNWTEDISGLKSFKRLKVIGDVWLKDGLVNECYLDKAILLDSDQRVLKKMTFESVKVDASRFEVKDLTVKHLLSGHNFPHFLSDVVILYRSNGAQITLQHKHFHLDLYVNKIVAAGSMINQHNLTQIAHNSLMVYGDQIVTGKHVFLKPVRMGHLVIHPKMRISDRAFEEFVLLDQKDIIIESDVVFDRNLEVKSLTVHGLVGQCNLTDTAQHSIYRNPIDHHFHLTTVYNVPEIVVLRNLQLPRQINGQPNFILQIGLMDYARPYPNGIRFETNVIANHLVVAVRFVIEHPPSNHQFPHFDHLKLIIISKPNLSLESSGTQLLVSVDYYNALRVFQFFNQSPIHPMKSFGLAQVRFQMNRPSDQFECVKIRAFVLQPRDVVKVSDFGLIMKYMDGNGHLEDNPFNGGAPALVNNEPAQNDAPADPNEQPEHDPSRIFLTHLEREGLLAKRFVILEILIVGLPDTGKSSLLNFLQDGTEIPAGYTRSALPFEAFLLIFLVNNSTRFILHCEVARGDLRFTERLGYYDGVITFVKDNIHFENPPHFDFPSLAHIRQRGMIVTGTQILQNLTERVMERRARLRGRNFSFIPRQLNRLNSYYRFAALIISMFN